MTAKCMDSTINLRMAPISRKLIGEHHSTNDRRTQSRRKPNDWGPLTRLYNGDYAGDILPVNLELTPRKKRIAGACAGGYCFNFWVKGVTMGHNKKYQKDLHQQAYDRLTGLFAFGESRHDAKVNDSAENKVYSTKTYNTYWKGAKAYIKWIKQNHPEITQFRKARRYVSDYLRELENNGYSPSTVHTRAASLRKIYDIKPSDDDYFTPSMPRRREDFTRSRIDAKRDRHFSVANNQELVNFARGVMTRRFELEALRGEDLRTYGDILAQKRTLESKGQLTNSESKVLRACKDALLFDDISHFAFVRRGKGGKPRFAPIFGDHEAEIVKRFEKTNPKDKVWEHVHSDADIHAYRAEGATALYRHYARKIEDIPYDKINHGTGKMYQSEVYVCRKDERGRKLDRAAMLKCSKALGHNRADVVAKHYLRGL